MGPRHRLKPLTEIVPAVLTWQTFHLHGDAYEQIRQLVSSKRSGFLTIHFHQGSLDRLEWREAVPLPDFKSMTQGGT